MNRIIMMTTVVLVLPMLLTAQINWTEHPIDTTFSSAHSVYATDMDGDDDVDVLGAAIFADNITWWENADGIGTTWIEHTIADNFDGSRSVYAINLDGDNDIDVLAAAMDANDITWWENTDGAGTAWIEHTIAGNFDGPHSVYAEDIDGDSDIDVLGAAYDADDVTWWENADDTGMTWIEHTIDGNFNGAHSVYARDIDGDDDVDVLGAAYWADDIAWWENTDGAGTTWNEHTIADNFDGARSVYACDIDGDCDVDVLGAAFLAGDIFWWESDLTKTHDVGTVSIDVPSSVPEDTALNPHATLTNVGINTETFNVTCTIDPGEYTSTTESNIAPGESIQVTFPDEVIFTSGVYTVIVYTRLGSDENPSNDTLEKTIETYDPGIAEGSSNIPLSFAFTLKSNPAKGKALFNLALPEAATVTLTIYDISGRMVDNVLCGMRSAGYYEILWDSKTASGIYFYKLVSPWKNEVGKLVLVR
jgi:hypothetical protein